MVTLDTFLKLVVVLLVKSPSGFVSHQLQFGCRQSSAVTAARNLRAAQPPACGRSTITLMICLGFEGDGRAKFAVK